LTNNPGFVWTLTVANAAFFLAYAALPVLLVRVAQRRRDIPFNGMIIAFGAFIALCGLSHLAAIFELWFGWGPVFWFSAIVYALGGLISVLVACLFWRSCPMIFQLPSRADIEKEVAGRLSAEEALRQKRVLLADAGHELRTPLGPMMAALEMLEDSLCNVPDSQLCQAITTLRRCVERETTTINRLLDAFELRPAGREDMKSTPRVFIVEDHQDTLRTLSHLFQRRGYEVESATTLKEAREKWRSGDMLVCDIRLPDGTGWDLMRELRQFGAHGVALSGFATSEDRKKSLAAGFSAHLAKPSSFEQIRRALFMSAMPT
jgi:CheY-like chemotaxis protein